MSAIASELSILIDQMFMNFGGLGVQNLFEETVKVRYQLGEFANTKKQL